MSAEPLFEQPDTHTMSWVREMSGRPVDPLQLAFLSDVYAPRIFLKSKAPRPSSTVTMSVYFHATEAELTEVGDDYLLSDVTGTRAEHSTVGSQVRLWSPRGALLATSEQLCWFKCGQPSSLSTIREMNSGPVKSR
jgi:acyl-CoA thioesterase